MTVLAENVEVEGAQANEDDSSNETKYPQLPHHGTQHGVEEKSRNGGVEKSEIHSYRSADHLQLSLKTEHQTGKEKSVDCVNHSGD